MMKNFKLILLLSIIWILPALACSNGAIQINEEQSVVERHGQLSVKGNQMVNEKGEPVALHGVSLGWHNWWPRFYNKGTVRWLISDWHCTVLRAAIGVEPNGAFLDNPERGYNLLYKVIDAAIDDGIYVIVDWHSHNILTDDAREFFTTVATRYKGVPNIIYEIFNEPEYDSWEDVKVYSEEIIKTIRKIDDKNIILVGNPHWDQDIHLVADDPIIGYENIMYSVHFYAATHGQFLRDRTEYALKKGIPVFVSECAATQATGTGEFNMREWDKWLDFMDNHKLSYVMWSIADKDELCSMVKDQTSPASHWTDGDLKEWGLVVRDLLRRKMRSSK